MSRWLPPAGGGYSGRSTTTGRKTKTAVHRNAAKTKNADGPAKNGGRVIVTPKSTGSAGVSRAS